MQKKIIILAIAAALSVPSLVAADSRYVNVYGTAKLSFDRVDSGGSKGIGTNQVSSNGSFIGFKGSKEIGDDMSVIWQVEQMVNLDNSSTTSSDGYGNTLATRNTFVSLWSSDYGIFAMGRYNTPYKIVSRHMDVFADTIADNRSLMGGASLDLDMLSNTDATGTPGYGASAGASFDGNQGDVAAWVSPSYKDFMFALAYVAGAEAASLKADDKGDAWSSALLYSNGTLEVNLGYELHNFGSPNTGTLGPAAGAGALGGTGVDLRDREEYAWKLAASYVFDQFVIYGVYEQTHDDLGGTPLGGSQGSSWFGHKSAYLGGKYQRGKNTVTAAYTYHGDLDMDGNGSDTGAQQFSLGYSYKLDRSTSLFGVYSRMENEKNARFNLSSADGSTGSALASGAGADPFAFSIGVKHKF